VKKVLVACIPSKIYGGPFVRDKAAVIPAAAL
jgi:hypothetical protein